MHIVYTIKRRTTHTWRTIFKSSKLEMFCDLHCKSLFNRKLDNLLQILHLSKHFQKCIAIKKYFWYDVFYVGVRTLKNTHENCKYHIFFIR